MDTTGRRVDGAATPHLHSRRTTDHIRRPGRSESERTGASRPRRVGTRPSSPRSGRAADSFRASAGKTSRRHELARRCRLMGLLIRLVLFLGDALIAVFVLRATASFVYGLVRFLIAAPGGIRHDLEQATGARRAYSDAPPRRQRGRGRTTGVAPAAGVGVRLCSRGCGAGVARRQVRSAQRWRCQPWRPRHMAPGWPTNDLTWHHGDAIMTP
jgi:hypothetical protein